MENFSNLSHWYLAFLGRIALTILCPSSGGIGSRLKNASAKLITVNVNRKFPKIELRFGLNIRFIIASKQASKRLDVGPARAVIAVPNSLLSKLFSFIGTGLLHPNLKIIIESAPKGSMWDSGFRVNLPSAFAVGSPNLKAARP